MGSWGAHTDQNDSVADRLIAVYERLKIKSASDLGRAMREMGYAKFFAKLKSIISKESGYEFTGICYSILKRVPTKDRKFFPKVMATRCVRALKNHIANMGDFGYKNPAKGLAALKSEQRMFEKLAGVVSRKTSTGAIRKTKRAAAPKKRRNLSAKKTIERRRK